VKFGFIFHESRAKPPIEFTKMRFALFELFGAEPVRLVVINAVMLGKLKVQSEIKIVIAEPPVFSTQT